MGFIEDIQKFDLSDEQKATLIASHKGELDPVKRDGRKERVEREITEFSDAGFSAVPGALAYLRRVFLSDDEEPGGILLSDSELGLSGDNATGAKDKEEVTVAGAVRTFAKLLCTASDSDGKLKLALSDQQLAASAGERPPVDDPANKDKSDPDKARERLSDATGRTISTRSRKRYSREGRNELAGAGVNGGDSR